MKTFELTPESVEEYEDFLSLDMAEHTGRQFHHELITLDDDDDPAAAILFRLEDVENEDGCWATIRRARFDDTEAAKEVFKEYTRQVSELGIKRSYFELPDAGLNREVFEEAGFSLKIGEGIVIRVTIEDFGRFKIFREKPDMEVVRIKELGVREYRQGIEDCIAHSKRGVASDVAYLPMGWFDKDISVALKNDGKICGFFLLHLNPLGELVPMMLCAVGDDIKMEVVNMLRVSYKACVEKYSKDTVIKVIRHDDAVRMLTDRLFPEKKGREVLIGERMET
ncbi:MAG: hypothetical protein IJ805_00975 [Lachnospiraceae bacterium]|nr:hypothetical protein [Lachnospiraceae bacterium]